MSQTPMTYKFCMAPLLGRSAGVCLFSVAVNLWFMLLKLQVSVP